MLELERLQVRVVSGRLGRKGAGEDDEDEVKDPKKSGMPPITDPTLLRRDSLLSGRRDSLLGGTHRDSITGLLSAADMASGSINRNNSLGWPGGDAGLGELMQRRSSSLGLSLMPDNDVKRRNSSLNLGSGLDGGDPSIPPHRPLVGGGSAAAYEAARADHYTNMAAQKARSDDQQRRASGLGSLGAGASQMGLSVNPNQHYEMLKLHHMNLLNEIQETTLMMNLYQQQQLQQQQQQQLQQQTETPAAAGSDQMALLLQQQGMGGAARMGSLGLGGGGGGGTNASAASGDMQALLRQQQAMMAGGSGGSGIGFGNAAKAEQGTEDESALQSRLQALKDDIARHQKEAEDLGKPDPKIGGSVSKRKSDDGGEGQDAKRVKNDGD
jgi:hypothetical protein